MSARYYNSTREYSVSIIIPCRNERGNIEETIKRTPVFGVHQEFILVEGHSTDGTHEEVRRLIVAMPDKDIKLFRQIGEGKNDAVRLGFSRASGEIAMILDADLTIMPEVLPEFYAALRDRAGEFICGSRLARPMEKGAMPLLNLAGNKVSALFFSWLLHQRFTDTLCGVKAMFRDDYQRLAEACHDFKDIDPWGDFSLILGAARLNLKILEIPVHYLNRKYGVPQIKRLPHTLLLFRLCIAAAWRVKVSGMK